MKKKQKYVTIFVVLLFCALARASVGDCLNVSVSEKNNCLRSQGDEAYNRAVDYFLRGVSYLNSSDMDRALVQLNLSKSSLLEANASYGRMEPTDLQLIARVDAAFLQLEERMSEVSASGNMSQPTLVRSSASSSSTTLMSKVSVSAASSQQTNPSGNQILLVAAAVLFLAIVGALFLKKRT